MNVVSASLNFIFETLIRPIFSSIFKLLKTNHHPEKLALHTMTTAVVVGNNGTGIDNPLQNTEVPNTDTVDHSKLVVNIHEIESNRRHSAASNESATGHHSHLTQRMQPQLAANAANETHEYRPVAPHIIQAPNHDNRLPKWMYFMVVTYLTAIGISLQALETMKNVPELPESSQFHYFRMFLVISLVYLTISGFVRLFSVPAALIVEQVGVLFGFLAFILVITISDFPSEVIKASSATFIVSLFIVFLATYLCRH